MKKLIFRLFGFSAEEVLSFVQEAPFIADERFPLKFKLPVNLQRVSFTSHLFFVKFFL